MKVNVVYAHPQHSVYDISPEAREKFAQKVEQRFAQF